MEMKNSTKLTELCNWEYIDEVNERLDSGENAARVHAWITSQGFKISHPMVYEYARRRRLATVEKVLTEQYASMDAEELQNCKRTPIIDIRPGALAVKRLRSDLDALESIIQIGYNNLLNIPIKEITPKLLMEAIALKDKITEGAYGHQTEFGLYRLRELEKKKTAQIGEILVTFIPEDRREEAIAAIKEFEDVFYMDTEYYTDYLKATERGY